MWLRRGFNTFLQEAKDLPINSYTIADFAKRLEVVNHRDAETWNVMQRKFIRGGFVFTATKTFLGCGSKVGMTMLPEFREDYEDLISTSLLSKRRLLRLLRYYTHFNPPDEFMKRFLRLYTNVNVILRKADMVINAYASFWKVAPPEFMDPIFKHIYSEECLPDITYRCYDFAVRLGDTERMNLLDNFGPRISKLEYSSFVELGRKIVTVSNLAKYKEEWLSAVPSIISICTLEFIVKLFKTLQQFNPPVESHPAIIAALVSLPATIELHEKILLAKDVTECFDNIGKEYAKALCSEVKTLRGTRPDEAAMCEVLLKEIVEEGS